MYRTTGHRGLDVSGHKAAVFKAGPSRPHVSARALSTEPTPSSASRPSPNPAVADPPGPSRPLEQNQWVRDGGFEKPLVVMQATKADQVQESITATLKPYDASMGTVDVIIVGAGPAGLKLAGEMGKRGLKVCIIGMDLPFTNNYGVWVDEFRSVGMGEVLDNVWEKCTSNYGEGNLTKIDRPYGRVGRRLLRTYLLNLCNSSGNVTFIEGEAVGVDAESAATVSSVTLGTGQKVQGRLVTLCAGAAAAKFLKFEDRGLDVAVQTAYGIEAEVEGYEGSYDRGKMLFMDYRRHHTGVWEQSANNLIEGEHPNAGDGLWGSAREAPSFLYAMPLSDGRVFLEETCLVTKPALPFMTLKRRLERRLKALNIKVVKVHDEEWSYIPVGGALPRRDQPIAAFGATANMIHPATGYSLTRSMQESVRVAETVSRSLKDPNVTVGEVTGRVWDQLWDKDRRKAAAFQVFGMELLAGLDNDLMNQFFQAFFRLPRKLWVGFLSSNLSPNQLLIFALTVFVTASFPIKFRLMYHLATSGSSKYLYDAFLVKYLSGDDDDQQATKG